MTNKSCEHGDNGEYWEDVGSHMNNRFLFKKNYPTCPFCAKSEHEEKPSAEYVASELENKIMEYVADAFLMNGMTKEKFIEKYGDKVLCVLVREVCQQAITQERLAWEKKVDELVKTQLHHLNLLSDYQKKVAELETLLRSTNNDKAFWQDRISTLQSKLDEAVKALEWYAKNNTKTHWQRKRAEEALRKIKEM